MGVMRGYGRELVTTATWLHGWYTAILGLVTLALSVVAGWTAGPAWGLTTALAALLTLTLITGARLYRRLAQDGDRRRRMTDGQGLRGETFRLVDLLEPGTKPAVANRTFEDCVIHGPAIIVSVGQSVFEHCTFEGDLPGLVYEIPPGPHFGVIGIVHCTFRRCTFVDVGFAGPSDFVRNFLANTGQI